MKTDVFFGPPGTGKTRKLMDIMADMKRSGVPTDSIGFVTFTVAGAAEALRRLDLRHSKTIRTIHSFCYALCEVSKAQVVDYKKVQEFAELVGYPIKGDNPDGTIDIGEGDEMMSVVQYARSQMISLGEAHSRKQSDIDFSIVVMFAEAYSKWKDAYGYLDFDDMIVRATSQDIDLDIDYLFVDEAQDLTPLQWKFIHLASKHVKRVILAGDDDQCIYAWGGADPLGMSTFDSFATSSVLSQSYRVPRSIHELAQTIIHRVANRVEKRYNPRNGKGSIEEHYGLEYAPRPEGNSLVLYRNHKSRREIENWLLLQKVAYATTGHFQSAINDRYANAVRAWQQLKAGLPVAQAGWDLLIKHADGGATQYLKKKNFKPLSGYEWWNVLHIPYDKMEYLRAVDLEAKPTVILSTIHSSKGMEADNVFLLNEMGGRTWANLDDNEHRVWYVGVTRARENLHIIKGENPYDLEVV